MLLKLLLLRLAYGKINHFRDVAKMITEDTLRGLHLKAAPSHGIHGAVNEDLVPGPEMGRVPKTQWRLNP